jgi:hypothetical protein
MVIVKHGGVMTFSSEGWFWILGGLYFTLAGQGLLPLPRNIRRWFDEEGRERYRTGLRVVGPTLLITGVALIFRLL